MSSFRGALQYLAVGVCCNLILVLITSIVAYGSSGNYGEAAVALSAGLLALFSVNWDTDKTIGFFIAWVVFSLFAIAISSINLASQAEEIYLDAAQSVSLKNTKEVEKELRKISKAANAKRLGPIACAEVIRLFAYRKLPVESMQYALSAVETLSIITKADHNLVAVFVVDIYKMFDTIPGPRYKQLLDHIYNVMRETPVSPKDFIIAFSKSRRIALSGMFTPETYFEKLTEALEKGVAPEEVYESIQDSMN